MRRRYDDRPGRGASISTGHPARDGANDEILGDEAAAAAVFPPR
ncbi:MULTISPECIES: hypothetical protein [Streptomyces]|uniref:Uncharacterized protein n=1 Tax=Streptomyces griseosporeus TaxID=1910 RepID=A0ABV3KU85_STRGS|nr:hypothetical protein [Streptomyces actuosus]